jgi:signal transduction histidine kinase
VQTTATARFRRGSGRRRAAPVRSAAVRTFTRGGGRERVGGTGLGLAIARSYARAHDGDLVYEDVDPHGARFQLVLPVKKNRNSEPDEPKPPKRSRHTARTCSLAAVSA